VRRRSACTLACAACVPLFAGTSLGRATASVPVPTALPTVAGIAAVGKQLTAQTGTWDAAGALTYSFQWYRCDSTGAACLSIHGAVAATYTVVARDSGSTLGLTVTATGPSGGTAEAYANLVGPVAPARALLESTVQPAISGNAVAGKALQVSTGGWSPTPLKLSYGWQRCNANGRLCTQIAAATSNSYTPVAADVGHALAAVVQATFGTTTQAAFSSASMPVMAAGVAGPVLTSAPELQGTEEQGEQLTISPGVWKSAGTIAFHFQWYRCDEQGAHCSSVHGATAGTYRLTARDTGQTIGATIQGTDSTGTAVAYTSLAGPIATTGAQLAAVGQPEVSGEPKADTALTAGQGSWTAKPTSTSFTWMRCNPNGRLCVAIPGATASTYTPTAADLSHRLVAVVTAGSEAGSATAFSLATQPVL
jgi:Ig domain of plant-specific actin-binding protein